MCEKYPAPNVLKYKNLTNFSACYISNESQFLNINFTIIIVCTKKGLHFEFKLNFKKSYFEISVSISWKHFKNMSYFIDVFVSLTHNDNYST